MRTPEFISQTRCHTLLLSTKDLREPIATVWIGDDSELFSSFLNAVSLILPYLRHSSCCNSSKSDIQWVNFLAWRVSGEDPPLIDGGTDSESFGTSASYFKGSGCKFRPRGLLPRLLLCVCVRACACGVVSTLRSHQYLHCAGYSHYYESHFSG
jgi:hypothetical protein